MQQRNRFKQTVSLEDRLAEEARRLREAARLRPPGAVRDAALWKARQAELASHMSESLSSRADVKEQGPRRSVQNK
jgi:hypothetical protein